MAKKHTVAVLVTLNTRNDPDETNGGMDLILDAETDLQRVLTILLAGFPTRLEAAGIKVHGYEHFA